MKLLYYSAMRPSRSLLKYLILMKLILIFLTTLFLQQGYSANAQLISISKKNISLHDVLKEIRMQTGNDFFFDNATLSRSKKIDIDIKKGTLEEVLNSTFKDQPLSYTISGNTIVVKGKEERVQPVEIKENLEIQQQLLAGKVTDEKGEELAGVNITVKGTTRGTTTDGSGKFQIEVQLNSTLVFSYIGFLRQELVYAGQSPLNVVLMEDNTAIDEVVVVGYGTQKKVNLTGAVSQIDSKVLDDRPVSNVTQAMQGSMPNVNVSFGNGRPGTEGSVNIRGYASINSANAAPLILIDGVPGNINNINPRDVESISVLKDAAASAIYGSRGAFGVMLVTTKSAKGGKVAINYSNNFGFAGSTVSTDFMTDGYDAARLNDEAFMRATGNSYTGYTEADYEELFKRKTDKSLPDVVIQNRKGKDQYVYYGNTDWWSVLYRDQQTSMEHALSFTGGTEKMDFYLSGRMYDKNGIMQINQDKFKSYNLRAKLSGEVASWFRVSNNTQFNYKNYTFPGWNGSANANNNFISSTVHALPSYVPINPDGTATYRTELNSYTIGDGIFADLLHGKSKGADGEYEFVNSFQALFSITKGLNIIGDYTFSHNPQSQFTRRTQAPWSIYPGVISYLGTDRLTEIETKYNNHVMNIFADYQRSFNVHNIKVTAGYNQEHRSYKRITGIRFDLLSEDLNDLNLGSGAMEVTGGANTWALMGFFGRINYDYKDRYLFEVNGRYDGTSKFPAGQRFGFFPSVSAGWRISEEPFFSSLKNVINEFKIRGSYGSLGNSQEAAVYGYIPLLNRGSSTYIMNGRRTEFLSVPTPTSPMLTWERATTSNIGIDINLFNNRLNTSFDLYQRNTLDMLVPGKTLPATFGAASPKTNAGDLRNTGWELSVVWRDQKMVGEKPLGYNVSLGLSDSKAKITRFDNREKLLNNHYVGQQLGEIWGYRVDGLFQSNEEADNWKTNQDYVNQQRLSAPGNWSKLQAGDMKFIDLNGDGKVNAGDNTLSNPGDQVIIGNALPRYTFGINLGANWHGFDISGFFQGIGRQHWYPGNNADKFWGPYSRPYYSFVPRNFTDDIWTPENPDAYFPLLRGYTALNNRGSLNVKNDRYLQDLAYIRLKNLTVGYSLPTSILGKAKISRARFYVSGENVFTLTKLRSDYIDPENASGEVNGRSYPFSKTFSLGIDITL